jgi:hypothetical protein
MTSLTKKMVSEPTQALPGLMALLDNNSSCLL